MANIRFLNIRALSFICLAALISASPARALTPLPDNDNTNIVPHRAVYELDLSNSLPSANMADASGRMVFEFTGSKCEGYLVNMRFVLTIADTKGKTTLTDVRTSSWEAGKGERFRFNSSQYFNQKLSKTTIGDAERKATGEGIDITLKSPKKAVVNFADKAYFPSEHTRLMIRAAQKGETVVNAPIYDGSENGNTLYETTAFIGNALKSDTTVIGTKIKNLDKLKDMISWPVSLSFYDKKKSTKQDLLPDYEISFRLYKNGVSRNLLIDYGDFSLKGVLSNIEFLPETNCQ